jgi:hypothetical protein
LTNLVVLPPERLADIIDMSRQTPPKPALPPADSRASIENILTPQALIVALKQTSKGKANILAVDGDFGGIGGAGEKVANILDGSLGTKYFNKAQGPDCPPGIDTGFVVTPAAGAKIITGIQFATANDSPGRDPVSITIEGSNDPHAAQADAKDFTLIYEGTAGLDDDPDRNHWGRVVAFKNTAAYTTYRVLVTATRSDVDAVQFSEVKLGKAVQPQKESLPPKSALR